MRDDCGHSLRGAQTGKMRDQADLAYFRTNGWFRRIATLADETGSRLIWCIHRVKLARAAVRADCSDIAPRMTELRTFPPLRFRKLRTASKNILQM
tara:strand:- start:588 stop:875 length:288 start_codon:yes stop_codon:yes gene_type:complete